MSVARPVDVNERVTDMLKEMPNYYQFMTMLINKDINTMFYTKIISLIFLS